VVVCCIVFTLGDTVVGALEFVSDQDELPFAVVNQSITFASWLPQDTLVEISSSLAGYVFSGSHLRDGEPFEISLASSRHIDQIWLTVNIKHGDQPYTTYIGELSFTTTNQITSVMRIERDEVSPIINMIGVYGHLLIPDYDGTLVMYFPTKNNMITYRGMWYAHTFGHSTVTNVKQGQQLMLIEDPGDTFALYLFPAIPNQYANAVCLESWNVGTSNCFSFAIDLDPKVWLEPRGNPLSLHVDGTHGNLI